MKTMEQRLLEDLAAKDEKIRSLEEQLEIAEDALNYLIMSGGGE